MTVEELIKELQKMPQNARVFHLWDGNPRTAINIVYESKSGHVITSDFEMDCYNKIYTPKIVGDYNGTWQTPSSGKYIPEDDLDY